jgi:uncharacterized protein (TIGR02246 family)
MSNTNRATAIIDDDQAVLDVIKAIYDAWAANDANLFAELYLDDATVVQPGVYKKNNDDIRTSMAALFAGPLKGSTVVDAPQSVRYLGEDVALVISEGAILMAGQTEPAAGGRVRATWVLAKRDGQWCVAAYHNSPAD